MTDRRGFFAAVLSGLGVLTGAALILPAARYLLYSPPERKQPEWVGAGDTNQFGLNEPAQVFFRRNRADAWRVVSEKDTAWVVRTSPAELVAFSPWCTHLGCAYHWDPLQRQFLCPCHGSVFAIDGKVVAGPAPRALDRYETKTEGGELMLGAIQESKQKA